MKLTEVFKNRNLIWEGLRNKIFKKEHIEEVYKERLSICKKCVAYDTEGIGCFVAGTAPCCNQNVTVNIEGSVHQGCGCSLSLKLRSLSSECPFGKWKALTNEQEEEMIKSQIEKNETKSS